MILTISIWIGIYLLCFLLRKHLDFGLKQRWPYHWAICWGVPGLILLFGVLTHLLSPQQIFWFSVTSSIMGPGKEIIDHLRGKKFSVPDMMVSIAASFSAVFGFVEPILQSLEITVLK